MRDKGDTSSIYDWLNAKPQRLKAALENQKKINQYIFTCLEEKNKVICAMEARICRLELERIGE